jgi:hypothetical protein
MFDVNGPPGIVEKGRTCLKTMADDRVTEWARALGTAETRAFMKARRRFLRRPSSKHLRELRSAARHLRSLFEDFRDVLAWPRRKALRRLIQLTGEARDASAARKTLRDALDARERREARTLLRELRALERGYFSRVRRVLAVLRYTS